MTNHLQSSSFNTPNGFGTPHQQNPNFNHSPIGSLNQVTEVLSNRIDQLFGMVTSSQQALFIQQGLTAKLELELQQRLLSLLVKQHSKSLAYQLQGECLMNCL